MNEVVFTCKLCGKKYLSSERDPQTHAILFPEGLMTKRNEKQEFYACCKDGCKNK